MPGKQQCIVTRLASETLTMQLSRLHRRQSCGLQEQLETTEDMLTQLNSTWQTLAADDSDVTSLANSCQQLQSLHDFRQQLADSEHHVTSLAAQAQQLQATADAASGDVIRARAADIEERWLKLTQAVEETEQEAQVSADVMSRQRQLERHHHVSVLERYNKHANIIATLAIYEYARSVCMCGEKLN